MRRPLIFSSFRILPTTLTLLTVMACAGQSGTGYIQGQVSTDLFQIIEHRVANIHVGLRTKRIGISYTGAYLFTERQLDGFIAEVEKRGSALHGLAYFPLHCSGPQMRIGSVPCPSWGPKGRRREARNCISGAGFIHIGYRKDVITYSLRQGGSEEIQGPTYVNRIVIPGVDMRLGYALQYWRLFMEIGYGLFAGLPRSEGRVDLFGDRLYTGIHPFKYRIETSPELRVGFNIPLYRN